MYYIKLRYVSTKWVSLVYSDSFHRYSEISNLNYCTLLEIEKTYWNSY